MTYMGVQSLITLMSHVFFVCLTFWALQSLRTDKWFRKYSNTQARLLYVLISVAVGYTVSSFFMEFVLHSQNLMHLFN